MSIRRFAAHYVFPVEGQPIRNGVVEVDERGCVRSIAAVAHPDALYSTEFHSGVIVPGFVNAHCHLELSHLRGVMPAGLGLAEFVRRVGGQRRADMQRVEQAIARAVDELQRTGTVAVADICNTSHTIAAKRQAADLQFCNLVEVFGIGPHEAAAAYAQAKEVQAQFGEHLGGAQLVPHAPYSVSDALWTLLRPELHGGRVSIHLGECQAEYELLQHGRGELFERYMHSVDGYSVPMGGSPEGVVERQLPRTCRPLLVHCTYAEAERLRELCASFEQATVVTCPESNLYLEGRLPNLAEWQRLGLHVAMGTDSLASATTLSMLHGINLALDAFDELTFAEVLRWATLGGAEALGLDTQLGSIAVGKRPGLCLIAPFDFARMRPSPQSTVRRLV